MKNTKDIDKLFCDKCDEFVEYDIEKIRKDDYMSDYSQQKTFCPECRKDVKYQIKNSAEEKEVRGLKIEYTAERAYCNECGSEIFISEFHDQNLQKINNAYREKRQGL